MISESTWITSTNVTHLTRHNGFSASAEERGRRAVAAKLVELNQAADDDALAQMRDLSANDMGDVRK